MSSALCGPNMQVASVAGDSMPLHEGLQPCGVTMANFKVQAQGLLLGLFVVSHDNQPSFAKCECDENTENGRSIVRQLLHGQAC